MAIVVTVLNGAGAGEHVTAEPAVSGSVSPNTGSELLAVVGLHSSSGTATLTATSGLSATWSNLDEGVYGVRRHLYLQRGTGWTGTGAVTFTPDGAENYQGCGIALLDVAGADGTTPFTAEADSGDTTGTGYAPTLTSISGNDRYLVVVQMEDNLDITFDSTNWTQLFDFGEANGMRRLAGFVSNGTDTTPALAWGATNGYRAFAFKITAAGDGSGTATPGAIAVTTSIPQATATSSNPFVTQVKSAAVTATRSPAFTLDTSPLENDVIYVWVSSTTAAAITDTTGWTNVLGANTDVESDAHEMLCVYHVVTAAEDTANTVTWTLTNIYDATETGAITAVVVRNVDPADPLAGVGSTFDSANTVTPAVLAAVTPDASGGLVLSAVVQDSTATYTTPGGWTVRSTFNTNQGLSVFSFDTGTTASTPVGPTNVTPDAGDEYISITVVAKMKVDANATATPGAIAVAATIPAATPQAGSVPTPAAIPVPITLPAVTTQAGAAPTPAAISVPVTVPQATPQAGSVATPAAIPVPITLPAVTAGEHATVTPDAIPVVITLPAATPQAGSAPTPAAISVPISIPQATPQAGAVPTPNAIVVVVTLPAVSASGGSTAFPDAIPVPVSIPQATPQAGSVPTPDAIAVVVTLPAATASGQVSDTATPDAIPVPITLPAVTTQAGSAPTPAAIAVTISIPQASASGATSDTATPDAIPVPVTLPAVTTQAGSAASPDAIPVPITVPQATPQAGTTASPDAIQVLVSLPQASASGATPGTASPGPITVTTSMGSVTTQAGSTASPQVITVPITIPAASASGSGSTSPDVINVDISIGAVSATGGALATPQVISVPVTLPQASPTGGGTATPGVIDVVIVLPYPTVDTGVLIVRLELELLSPELTLQTQSPGLALDLQSSELELRVTPDAV